MMRITRCLLFLLLCSLPQILLASNVPGELIVRLKNPPQRSTLDQISLTGISRLDNMAAQGQVAMSSPYYGLTDRFRQIIPVVLLRFDIKINMDSLEAELAADPAVEWVTRNHIYQPNFIPNDSMYSEEWWLEKISAPEAWDITQGDSAIIIGIVDTGIDYTHPDLRSKIWVNRGDANSNGIDDDHNGFVDDSIGWDFVDAPSLPSGGDNLVRDRDPMDEMGHGTYVAGISGAATNNYECTAGIAINCKLMSLRAGNKDGYLEEDDAAAAILYGVANGARVINMSFGDVVASPFLREAVQIAYQAGVVLVGSAGNGGVDTIHYPSGFPEVISVGSTDRYDRKASTSNYGPSVDVMAPGEMILSTIIGGGCGQWRLPSGTSYSCPMVAGVVGLVLSVNPSLTPDNVKQLIRSTADDIGRPGWDTLTTHGRLNAHRAIEQAQFGTDIFARITFPQSDAGLTTDFTVRGEAWGAAFEHWELKYGLGESPTVWTSVNQGNQRVYGDSLGFIPIPNQDTILVVKLEAYSFNGPFSVDHQHLYVQRSAPRIDSMKVSRMLNRDNYGDLVHLWSDQTCKASLVMTNNSGDSSIVDFGYVSDEHAALISQVDFPGQWQVRVLLENQAGFSTVSNPFNFNISNPPFTSNLWIKSITNLPHGHLGPFTSDLDRDGLPEVWLAPIAADGTMRLLQAYEWNGLSFDSTGNTYGYHLPQAMGDMDGDGLMEMMARRFDETRIWEQSDSTGPCNNLVFEDTTNFIGTCFFDLDSVDSHGEILARQQVKINNIDRDRYVVFSVLSHYSLTVKDTLPNETEGSNYFGVPRVLVSDLDHDGKIDFLYGDYDGDLIFCEYDGSDIQQQWSHRLPLSDATFWMDKGDMDGDGEIEFIAGCTTNSAAGSESQLRSRHWEYFIFKRNADNSFAIVDSVFILGSENTSDHPASVTVGDVDADGKADILLSAYPDYYIISLDAGSQRYLARWYESPSETNVSLVCNWDRDGVNEFFYSDGEHFIRTVTASAAGQKPKPPYNLTGEPLNAHTIHLQWTRVMEADSYRIYQTTSAPNFQWLTCTSDTFITLSSLIEEQPFIYAVASVNMQFPDPISVLSNYVSVTANSAPSVRDTAVFIKPDLVRVSFTEAMGFSSLQQRSYHLDDGRMPSVVLSDSGGKSIILSFEGAFPQRLYRMNLIGLQDAQGSHLPDTSIVFAVEDTTQIIPRILTHRILGGVSATEVEITFSAPMSPTVVDASHYHVASPRSVLAVQALTTDRSKVQVSFDPNFPIGALGLPARLELRGVFSEAGVALDTTSGSADLLLGGAANSIDDAFVFPNPFKGIGPNGETGVHFAGLPERATIRIFTLQGTLVRKIEHNNFSGAEQWNLKNENDESIASGIYLYTIESDGSTKRGKLAILR